jgi:hypothetical protein
MFEKSLTVTSMDEVEGLYGNEERHFGSKSFKESSCR